jgi:dihydrofolate reductase
MILTMLAAADADWGIGLEGGLPWRVPEDLRWFKERTMGKTVVMGRNTVNTLPSKLPGRRIVTLTRRPEGPDETDLPGLLALPSSTGDEEIVIAGGGEVYRVLMPHCGMAEITRIKGEYRCDTHMPDLSRHGWTLVGVRPLSPIADIEQWIRDQK